MCACFECLRNQGVTMPQRRNWRGEYHYPPDGRFLLGWGKDEHGKTILAPDGQPCSPVRGRKVM